MLFIQRAKDFSLSFETTKEITPNTQKTFVWVVRPLNLLEAAIVKQQPLPAVSGQRLQ
jgi:hypothetical protein